MKLSSFGIEVEASAFLIESSRDSNKLRWGSERMNVWMCIYKKWRLLLGIYNWSNPFVYLLIKCSCKSSWR